MLILLYHSAGAHRRVTLADVRAIVLLFRVGKLMPLVDVVQNVLVLLLHLKGDVTLRRHQDVLAGDSLGRKRTRSGDLAVRLIMQITAFVLKDTSLGLILGRRLVITVDLGLQLLLRLLRLDIDVD